MMPDEIPTTADEIPTTAESSPGLAQMAAVLLNEQALDSILALVATLARDAVSGTVGVSVSLLRDGRFVTAAHTDEAVCDADGDQYVTGQGPCVAAATENRAFEIVSMEQERRWPSFTPLAVDRGMASSLSLPLTVRGSSIGALNFYSATEGNFLGLTKAATSFAQQASVVLANAQAYASAERLNENLKEALRTRELIGEAKGIVMEREKVSEEEAFGMISRLSQKTNTKLRDLAHQLVDTTQRPGRDAVNEPGA
jgi:GAF domain-containing protein